jgi:hypothetical protein
MSRLAVEKLASGEVTSLDASYNSSKWNLGSLIKQRKDLGTPFIGPLVVGLARPAEIGAGVANAGHYPWALQWDVSNGIDWVFLIDQGAAALNRRLHLWEFNRNTSVFTWKGFTLLNFPGSGVYLAQGFRMTYDVYNKGKVTVAGNIVQGYADSPDSSAAWLSDRLCTGSRIGFGSKDPTQITHDNWYTIGPILGDTSLCLTINIASPISSSTNYVIEDLRALVYTSNTTLYAGGLFLAKGLQYDDFTPGGTQCASCNTTIDSSKYVYRLMANGNSATVANLIDSSTAGFAIEPKIDWKTQYGYGLNVWGVTAAQLLKIYKYNVRAPLTILPSYGSTVSAINSSTNVIATSTATISRNNNGRFGKLRHGPLADVSALYFNTLTRVNAIKTADIVEGATAIIDSEMQEKPPGTVNTYAATASLSGIEIAGSIDRLVVMSTGGTAFRSYVTQYRTDLGPLDHIFLIDDKQLDQSIVDPNTTPHISTLSLYQAPWVEGGVMYITGTGATAVTNIMHAVPLGAEWTYSSSTYTAGRLISPKFSTPNCDKFVRAYSIRDNYLGNDIIGKRTDALRLSYRTSGIDDNTGSWTSIIEPNDMSGAGSSAEIQFLVEFKAITDFCVPARLFALGVVYDDTATDSHFRLSQVNSDVTTKTFAWRFVTAFDASVPTLKINMYDDVTNAPLLTDYTDVSTGTWQKSYNDGVGWVQYDSSDKGASNITYIRYTPVSLADNTKVRAVLTLK